MFRFLVATTILCAIFLLGAQVFVFGFSYFSGSTHAQNLPSCNGIWDTPGEHSCVVPEGVTELLVDVRGAAGDDAHPVSSPPSPPVGKGAKGARVQTIITVTPGDMLHLFVGGQGNVETRSSGFSQSAGGFNGGGNGATAWSGGTGQPQPSGGGGGGASDIRTAPGPWDNTTSLNSRIVIGGGGGGGGAMDILNFPGGDGGTGGNPNGQQGENGSDAGNGAGQGGTGATVNSGGAGGAGGTGGSGAAVPNANQGANGSLGRGGNGGEGTGPNISHGISGGGGGGGRFGGGGGGGGQGSLFDDFGITPGGSAGGGGGGSSFCAGLCSNPQYQPAFQQGNGYIELRPADQTASVTITGPAAGLWFNSNFGVEYNAVGTTCRLETRNGAGGAWGSAVSLSCGEQATVQVPGSCSVQGQNQCGARIIAAAAGTQIPIQAFYQANPGSYSWTVPSGVSEIEVELWGAEGARGSYADPTRRRCTALQAQGGAAGLGGYVKTKLTNLNAGDTVQVVVGAAGASPSEGGGASQILVNGTPVAVAGAGGGGGNGAAIRDDDNDAVCVPGAAGGAGGGLEGDRGNTATGLADAQNPSRLEAVGGEGGDTPGNAGGLGGGTDTSAGQDGSSGTGGAGGTYNGTGDSNGKGGDGGDGWYGGGGGEGGITNGGFRYIVVGGGGGGGGSSYVDVDSTYAVAGSIQHQQGCAECRDNGAVAISYLPPPLPGSSAQDSRDFSIDLTAPVIANFTATDGTSSVNISTQPLFPAGNSVTLNWQANDAHSGIAAYEVWRSPDGNTGWQRIGSNIAAGTTTFQDSPGEGDWWYGMRAFDSLGNCITEAGDHCGGVTSDAQNRTPVGPIQVIWNAPPRVDAGSSQNIGTFPATVNLDGTVTDDGFPVPPGAVTTTWSQVSGPNANIANPSSLDTTVDLPIEDIYVFRLEATDGQYTVSDEVTIRPTAYGLVPCGVDRNNPTTPWDEREACNLGHTLLLIRNVVDFAMWKLVPLIILIMVVLTGVIFYFQLGDVNTLVTVKRIWRYVGIGVLVLLFSWLALNFFLGILGFNINVFGQWYDIQLQAPN